MQLSLKDTLREARSAQMHTCAGMVLGIRMAILGCRLVGISEPRVEKVLKVYVEMDRCFTDAVGFLTGCSLGKRSLQHIDYGKPAATFHNTASEMAYRIAVPPDLRAYMESEKNGPRYGSGSKADLQKRPLPESYAEFAGKKSTIVKAFSPKQVACANIVKIHPILITPYKPTFSEWLCGMPGLSSLLKGVFGIRRCLSYPKLGVPVSSPHQQLPQ
jgi:formylmethanofuran dehydrogenase subunit E